MPFQFRAVQRIILDFHGVDVLLVVVTFGRRHIVIDQFLASLAQAGCLSVGTDGTGLQILNPLFKRSNGHFVEFVHADQIVFGEDALGQLVDDSILLLGGNLQLVACMYSLKRASTVVEIIVSLADIEIEDANRIDFFDFVVAVAQGNVFGDGFGHSIENTFQVIQLAGVLHFHNNDFPFAVKRFDIHAVELVFSGLLVALAFQQFEDGHFLVQEHSEEAFQYAEVSFLTKEALYCPVEADVFVLFHHIVYCYYLVNKGIS